MNIHSIRRWLYSLLHQLSVDDSVLVATLDEEGRLVLSDRLGEICWFELAENGRPLRQGFTLAGREELKIYETWSKSGDYIYCNELKIPYQDRETQAEYPERITSFIPNPKVDPSLFERPSAE